MTSLHPSLSVHTHLFPSLRSAWPTIAAHFKAGGLWPSTWASFYAHADPIHSFVLLIAFFASWVYIAQQITGNASQVDRLWTFLPVIFTAHFALHPLVDQLGESVLDVAQNGWLSWIHSAKHHQGHLLHPRLVLITLLTALWSARLTYNAIRRGVFKSGEEDYRWPLLRHKMTFWQWQLFSLFFISITQIILLAMTGLPAYLLLTTVYPEERKNQSLVIRSVDHLSWGDFALTLLFLLNLGVQTLADQQQWVYQNYKRGKDSSEQPLTEITKANIEKSTGFKPYDAQRGFTTNGLFAWSRHPNFTCEQNNWWILYFWIPLTFESTLISEFSWNQFFTFAMISPIVMNVLFLASTIFTEQVSQEKYSCYKAYQTRVDMFWPITTPFRGWILQLLYGQTYVQQLDQQLWGTSFSTTSLADAVTNQPNYGATSSK